MTDPHRLPRRPEARAEKVEDLVELTRRGQIRVPSFQRPLKWEKSDVADFFDSLYRGYPVGSLLFYTRSAPAKRLALGPLVIDAPEAPNAWWVVDGQQRIISLTACLARNLPLPGRATTEDPYVLYFDAATQRFESPAPQGAIPATWVPLPALLDGTRLIEWMFRRELAKDEPLRRLVFEAGWRLREYTIPIYVIETPDQGVAEEIFFRINSSGKKLEWTDVHKALFGSEGPSPATLEDLAADLAAVGMGRPSERRLLTNLVAMRKQDPTRSLFEHYRKNRDFLRAAVPEALPVLRRVLSFLRADAGVPHLRLLPKSILLDVLTRFFVVHPEPNPRSRLLLSRWLWRIILGAGGFDDRTLRRRGIATIDDDEEASVQRLLALVRKERPRPFELPEAFDARDDGCRIALVALAFLQPRDLESGSALDVPKLLSDIDKEAFHRIVAKPAGAGGRSPANRLLHPKAPVALALSRRIEATEASEDPVLASHAIDAEAIWAWRRGEASRFLAARAETLTRLVREHTERLAAWEHSDRPSVDSLLTELGIAS